MGFFFNGEVYDTMVAEYILAKAQRWSLGLAAVAEKYNVTQKERERPRCAVPQGRQDLYDIPWEIVEEYGKADVLATEEVALKQLDAFGTTFKELCYGTDFTTDVKAFA